MEASDTTIRLALMESWVEIGEAPARGEVARRAGVSEAEVDASYRRLADARVLVLDPADGSIWMANPFSAIPTGYRAEVGGRSYFGNCIWDGLGIVAMLGGTGRVATECPDCGEGMTLTIADGKLDAPDGAIAHFAVPASHWWEDIGFT